MNKERLLFASSEVYPFVKTGGLADVAHALPRALNDTYEVTVVLPLYRRIDRKRFSLALLESFEIEMGSHIYPVEFYGSVYEGVEYRFVYSPILSDREYLYGPPECGYEDNALRFGLFAYAIVELLRRKEYAIAHLNDWHCALAALLVAQEETIPTKTLYTIHNLAYQGVFDSAVLEEIGIDVSHFTMEGIEFYGQVNFMKAGIAYANAVSTVSPTYAKEIMTPEFGCGLEGFLRHHRRKVTGILNGIDTDHFSPENDSALTSPYRDLKGRKVNKTDFLAQSKLRGVTKPLLVFIGRFTAQKGMELLIDSLEEIASHSCNIAILGEGEALYCEKLKSIALRYPNIHLTFGYDEIQAHRLYAASDFILIPSLFEPCGLNQLIAFRYGTIPLVHHVGGLADTVETFERFELSAASGYGVVFNRPTKRSFLGAIRKALTLYEDKNFFKTIVEHNRGCDVSWRKSAHLYAGLYQKLLR